MWAARKPSASKKKSQNKQKKNTPKKGQEKARDNACAQAELLVTGVQKAG
jgi:hypothetical protein